MSSATNERIAQNLKQAMLSGDKDKVSVLRGLKSAILYEEVASGKRDQGLEEPKVLGVLAKESKKRQDSADLYRKGGNEERAAQELAEKTIIDAYLPAKMSQQELSAIVKEICGSMDHPNMGQAIGAVKAKVGMSADGGAIAKLVKEQLGS